MKKVFLGGTCNESKWREQLIPLLDIEYFNPVVEDWNEEAQKEEIRQRQNCDYVLYTITPKMSGVYSIAEVIDDSNKRPNKTILCVLTEDDGKSFDKHQTKSLEQVMEMVRINGGTCTKSLDDTAYYLNSIKANESNEIVFESFTEYLSKETKINEAKGEGSGCTMLMFDNDKFLEIIDSISDDDLYTEDGYGKEKESHITLLYGTDASVKPSEIEQIINKYDKIFEVEFKSIDLFENDKFDVIKFNVENKMLNEMNETLKTLPYKSDFPDYHAHMTLAYVKPGMGKKYIKELNEPIILKPASIVYSDKDSNKTTLLKYKE